MRTVMMLLVPSLIGLTAVDAAAVQSPATLSPAVLPAETLHVEVWGTGEPVVMLPGLFGSGYAYRNVVPLLSEAGYRSIVIEPLGMGSSSRPSDADYSLTAQADRIVAVLDTLEVKRAFLVAHSVGASIAFRMAYRHPEFVRAVVSLEGGAAEAATTRGFRSALKLVPVLRALGSGMLVQFVRRGMVRASADSSWIDEHVIREYLSGAVADYGATIKAYQAMAKAEEPESLHEHLRSVRCPVRLLVGGVRHRSGPKTGQIALLTERLTSFAIDTVPGAGHFIQEESPAAILAAIERLRKGDA